MVWITHPLSMYQQMSYLCQFSDKFFLNRKRTRRKQPGLFREKAFPRERSANGLQSVGLCEHRVAQLSTLTTQLSTVDHLPAAIFFSASLTSSSAGFASPFSWRSRTAL